MDMNSLIRQAAGIDSTSTSEPEQEPAEPPWRVTEPERLIWLVQHDADLYLPLPGEQGELWRQKYAERLQEVEATQQAARQFAGRLAG